MTVNWEDLVKDAGDAGFEALPEADYDLIVEEARYKQTKTSKKMYEVKCKVEAGPYANRRVWDNLVVTPENPNALAMFFRKMGALGLTPDFFKTKPSDDQIVNALRNRRFRGKVGQRTWQGQKKNEIQQYFPAMQNGSAPQAAPAAAPAPTPAPAPAPAPQPAAEAAPPPQAPQAPPAAPPAPAPAPAPVEPQAAAPEQPQVPQQPAPEAPAAATPPPPPAAAPAPAPQPQATEPPPQPEPAPAPAPPQPEPTPQPAEPQPPQPEPQPEPQMATTPAPPPAPAAPF